MTPEPKSMECVYCERLWPVGPDFASCPCCREGTKLNDVKYPMGDELAQTMRLDFAFGWWLWDTGRILTESVPEPGEMAYLGLDASQPRL